MSVGCGWLVILSQGVEVTGQCVGFSDSKLFYVCRVDRVSSNSPVLKFGNPQLRHTHE